MAQMRKLRIPHKVNIIYLYDFKEGKKKMSQRKEFEVILNSACNGDSSSKRKIAAMCFNTAQHCLNNNAMGMAEALTALGSGWTDLSNNEYTVSNEIKNATMEAFEPFL
jgi:phage protein D